MWLLAETTSEGWRPGIGDPTFMGWFTVFAYLTAAILCFVAAKRSTKPGNRPGESSKRFWYGLSILFTMLCINKQLDLQSWFTAVGRAIARRGGWYGERGAVQSAFVMTLAALGVVVILWLAWRTRRTWKSHGLAVVGTTFIIFFIIIRAGSFHHVDELLGWTFVGLRMNWIFELSGITCVAISALHFIRLQPPRRVPQSKEAERASLQWMFKPGERKG